MLEFGKRQMLYINKNSKGGNIPPSLLGNRYRIPAQFIFNCILNGIKFWV